MRRLISNRSIKGLKASVLKKRSCWQGKQRKDFRNHRPHEIGAAGLLSSQKAIQLGFQSAPAAADFDGLDATFGDVFEVSGAGNFEVLTGFFGGINDFMAVFIKSIGVAAIAPVKTAAPVGFFAPIFTASALYDMIVYHKYHLISLKYQKILLAFNSLDSIGKSPAFLNIFLVNI